MIQPAYTDSAVTLYQGDCLEVLRRMEAESVQTCVTSPPYYGLRDYGCDGQIGLERTPEKHIAVLVDVFREVRRVLRNDGTLWMNYGDTYGDNKQLLGMPWRVALALQANGWILRRDIIWHKSNPMPESATDRPTTAHEYIFLFAKQQRYYYDADAVKEPVTGTANSRGAGTGPKTVKAPSGWDDGDGHHGKVHRSGRGKTPGKNSRVFQTRDPKHTDARKIRNNESFTAATLGLVDERNKRSVWTVATAPFPDAHFATFPPGLIKPCILAGAPLGGVVLDPFAGAGTTLMVAKELSRLAIGIELNSDYCQIIQRRLRQEVLAFTEAPL